MPMLEVIPLFVVSVGICIASFTDIRRFKVYNALTFPVLLGGIIYGAIIGSWVGFLGALAGAFTGFAILLIPYLMGGLGAGDVKFVMAMGAWIGTAYILPSILIGCGVLFCYYLIVIARHQGLSGLAQNVHLMLMRLSCFGRNLAMADQFEPVQSAARDESSPNRGRLIPFSAMMSIGILIAIIIGLLTAGFA